MTPDLDRLAREAREIVLNSWGVSSAPTAYRLARWVRGEIVRTMQEAHDRLCNAAGEPCKYAEEIAELRGDGEA